MAADQLLHDLSALVDVEGRNRGNPVLGLEQGVLVDIDADDLEFTFQFGGQLVHDGSHLAARRAPGRPEIHQNRQFRIQNLGLEILLRYSLRVRHHDPFFAPRLSRGALLVGF